MSWFGRKKVDSAAPSAAAQQAMESSFAELLTPRYSHVEDLSELEQVEAASKVATELSEILEDDSLRLEEIRSRTGVTVVWRPALVAVYINVSTPLSDRVTGRRAFLVRLYARILRLPGQEDAREYVFAHNGIASTTYAWLANRDSSIACSASYIVYEDDAESLHLTADLIREAYAAAAGKQGFVLDPSEAPPEWEPVIDGVPIPGVSLADLAARAGNRRGIELLEYGQEHGNPWATLDPGWLAQWAATNFGTWFPPCARGTDQNDYTTLIPLLPTLAASDMEESRLAPLAFIEMVPDNHPYIGPGVRASLVLPHLLDKEQAVDVCNWMSRADIHDFAFSVPSAGSWFVYPLSYGNDEGFTISYTSFYAAFYHGRIDLEEVALNLTRRAQFALGALGDARTDASSPVTLATLPQDPDTDASDEWWDSLVHSLTSRLTLDDEWCRLTSESLQWWPSALRTSVTVPLAWPDMGDGVDRRVVRVATDVGTLLDRDQEDALLIFLADWGKGRPGCSPVLYPDGQVELTFAVTHRQNVPHSARYIATAMAYQSAYALELARYLADELDFEPAWSRHPQSGLRTDRDEIAGIYADGSTGTADVAQFTDPEVRERYARYLVEECECTPGWSDLEVCYFQPSGGGYVSVGMSVLTGVQYEFGSGVAFLATTGAALTGAPEENAALVNATNLLLAAAAPAQGLTISHTLSAYVVDTPKGNFLGLCGFLPAAALADYNSEDIPAQTRADLLAHYAMLAMAQARYVEEVLDAVREGRYRED